MTTFSDLSVIPEISAALERKGITEPTAVQQAVIPALLAGESVLFQSETGTGKTFAYLIPAFMKCVADESAESPKILVIAPTHELASQIKGEASSLAKEAGIPVTTALCIGGAPLKRQIEALKGKPTLLAGGPARILELIRLKKLSVRGIRTVILDETDRMLAPELRDILSDLLATLPTGAQYVACSATLSKYHASLLERMVPKAPVATDEGQATKPTIAESGTKTHRLRLITLPPEAVLRRNIAHWAFYSEGRDKIETLRRFILAERPAKALVFTAIAGQVENIAAQLRFRKIPCSALYAKLGKLERKKAMDDFRSGRTQVLVTSDLSARGLDIPNVTHIIQLDVNENEDFFIHRAGRTARAGKSGVNAVFGDERELRNLSRIEKKLGIVVYPKVLYGGKVRSPDEFEDDEKAGGSGDSVDRN